MLQQEDCQSAHAEKYCRVCTRMQKKSWQRSPGNATDILILWDKLRVALSKNWLPVVHALKLRCMMISQADALTSTSVYTQRLHLCVSYWFCLQQLTIGRQWQLSQVCFTGQPPEILVDTKSAHSHKLAKCFQKAIQPRNLHGISQSQFQLMPLFRQCYQLIFLAMWNLVALSKVEWKKSLPTFTCSWPRDVRLSCMLVPPSESTIQQWLVEVTGTKSPKVIMIMITSTQTACAAFANGQAVVN